MDIRKSVTPSVFASEVETPLQLPANWRELPSPEAPPRPPRSFVRRYMLVVGLLLTVGILAGVVVNLIVNRPPITGTTRPGSPPLPPNFEAEGEETLTVQGKEYYKKIVTFPGKERKERVVFVLIDQERDTDPATFYMMENKVWVGLFRQFAAEVKARKIISSDKWEKGLKVGKLLLNENDRMPIMGVVALDAHRFAQWLGGHLPTVRQWDKATGLYEGANRGKGPFQEPWELGEIAVGRDGLDGRDLGPVEVDGADKDVSLYGCRHMAGNGKEWTSDLTFDAQNRMLTEIAKNPQQMKEFKLFLRGQSWAAPGPLLFKDMQDNEGKILEDQACELPDPHIGFRVVIELSN
jgi:hypothetical protein